MKFKRIILCLFVFLMCLASFGCSNISLNTKITSSGIIQTKLNIQIKNSGNASEATVYSIVAEYFKQLENQYIVNLVDLYSNVYDFDAMGESEGKIYSDIEKFDYIYAQNINKFLISKSADDCKHDPVNKTIIITKQFRSIYAYLMYFYPSAFKYNEEINNVVISDEYRSMIDVPMGGKFEEYENLFITKYIQTATPFYYNGEEPYFFSGTTSGITARQTLVSVLVDRTGLSEEQVKLMFSFSTPYKRVHSDGTTTLTSSGYTHTWTLSNLGENIKLWRNYANYVPWYVLAGALGVLIFVIGAIVIVIINKIKKAKGMRALNKINNFVNKK